MANIVDRVFGEVCLDERISDGIFRMEEEAHMDALRDYFIKRGITKEAAIHVTNRMVEGKYPDRQAYRSEDGILVTWPSPQHKRKSMLENPGKYVEQNPFPKKPSEDPEKKERPDLPSKKEKPEKPEPEPDKEEKPEGNVFSGGSGDTVTQGDKQLAVEPPRGEESPEPPASIPPPTPQIAPRTPERVAAEKEVVKQIMKTDDTTLSNLASPINEACRKQLNELYKKADEMGYKEAVTFLTPFVKP
ncbi:MAG TPA: hypothetical protein VMW36_00135 [Patescibacteria group bacterium]|nr:hypothetical protein [Patescibacteria group bacterium]